MSEPTDLVLPKSLPYPIKVTKILVAAGDNIQRGTPLLYYSYKHYLREDKTTETCYGTWESYVEGRVDLWNIDLGDEVDKDYGPVLVVTEPCKHGTQIMGMCADCGKDMTEVDYMSIAGTERAKIKMDHGAEGPLLSQEVAAKIERENTDRLLKNRKLSLIVDLDQTILHATFDPTVGEWIKAKDAFEKRRSTTPPDHDPPPESVNWPALEDVISFQLPSDHGHMGHSERYYVKPRPGLQRFMNNLSELYEMHVYTMGVRSYANAICAALDPSGAWFGSRVLSRNESGSDRVKNLKRLFPSDQSMVVVIDDRADVWNWSPNLVRVIPFEFFVGTGDINASFLPKQASADAVPPADPKTGELPQEDVDPESEVAKQEEIQAEDAAKQLKERPLEKAQEALVAKVSSPSGGDEKEHEPATSAPIPLLKNDDHELDRIERILCDIHKEFYKLYDTRQKSRNQSAPDVLGVIPGIKAKTLAGVHLVFSGILPLDGRPERQPIWKAALEFGATCHVDINPQVTHLVTNKLGTVKADKAFAQGNIFVVNIKWFNDSLIKWERQPEANYLMERKPKNSSQDPETKTSEPPPNGGETKVGREDDAAGHGPNTQSSAPGNENEESSPPTPAAEPEQNEDVQLHIDWAEIDKEVDDALASDDDDDDGDEDLADEDEPKSVAAEAAPESRYMGGITPTTRGIKRPRSDDSTPSTPSRLRFSFNAADLARGLSPKRQKLDHEPLSNGPSKPSTQDLPESQVADTTDQTGEDTGDDDENDEDDDDDFLAREMAESD